MSGSDGSRGYLYQGIASVMRAFSYKNWDRIYVEYPSEGDKIDVGLEKEGALIFSIQVKSSINLFTKPDLERWIGSLIDDKPAENYELFLIGNCDQKANDVCKKLKRENDDLLAKREALKGLGQEVENCSSVNVTVMPFQIENLRRIAMSYLFEYICLSQGRLLTYSCIDFILSAMVDDHVELGTSHVGMSKDEFDEKLRNRIQLLTKQYEKQRVNIGIRSYERGSGHIANSTENMLCLLDKFEGRHLRQGLEWDKDILPVVEEFLRQNTNHESLYAIYLDTHPAVAFAAGRCLDYKSGINIVPWQKTRDGLLLWEPGHRVEGLYRDWMKTYGRIGEGHREVALIIGATRNIESDVIEYIKHESLPIGKYIYCYLDPATSSSIVDGSHCVELADKIYSLVNEQPRNERAEMIHIFFSAPNALIFYLGRISRGFGRCILYDFYFEGSNQGTYFPTITFA